MVRWVPAVPAAAVLLFAGCGRAGFEVRLPPEADATWGDGHLGDLDLPQGDMEINDCHPVITASSGTLSLVTGSIAAGELVVVWQVQDDVAVISSSAEIAVGATGAWEQRRVTAVAGGMLMVSPPLDATYGSGGARAAQVCTLPEYQDVTIGPGARLVASPWTGGSGGFVGFLARGNVEIDGSIDAAGAGFRGSEPLGDGGGTDETALVNDDLDQAGGIGEGIDAGLLGFAGRGNAANGGGGGGAFNAGGGGGGNGGRGGEGASQAEGSSGTEDCSGLGGAALTGADGRFAFGGGGGSGHQNDLSAGAGGNGGGVIWVRAFVLRGGGVLDASGADGEDSEIVGTLSDGAGGGGAGGTVIVETQSWSFEGTIRAAGGRGGSVDRPDNRGLGGGGGGGRASLPAGVELVPQLTGGAPGENQGGSSLDATAGEPAQ